MESGCWRIASSYWVGPSGREVQLLGKGAGLSPSVLHRTLQGTVVKDIYKLDAIESPATVPATQHVKPIAGDRRIRHADTSL